MNELQEKQALRELVDMFSIYEIDVDKQMTLFTPDVKLTVYMGDTKAMEAQGRDELGNTFKAFTATVKRAHHMNGQFVAELTSETTAKGTLYCIASLVTEEDGVDVVTDHRIYYYDTFEKVGGKWFIKSRESHFVISTKHTV